MGYPANVRLYLIYISIANLNLLKLYKILKQYSAMFIHSLNWVVIKYLPQVKFTFIEENLGGENT